MPGNLVALSGGMDSAVCLALAERDAQQGPNSGPVVALTLDYGQRHRAEIARATALCEHFGAEQLLSRLDATSWGGSALTDPSLEVPDTGGPPPSSAIPATYVPARNTILLAIALAIAEARDLDAVYIGVNALDYSGYPDCRPAYIDAFRNVARLGLKRGVEGRPVEICTPLIAMTKGEIVAAGFDLGVPFAMTWSCYRSGPVPCGRCDACRLRAKGFAEAGFDDPALGEAAFGEAAPH